MSKRKRKDGYPEGKKTLSIDISLNNIRLARIEITNENFESKKIKECRYKYNYYKTSKPSELLDSGQISHNRKEGIMILIKKILNKITDNDN